MRTFVIFTSTLSLWFLIGVLAYAKSVDAKYMSISGLYQTCSMDIETSDFGQTKCSMYIEGYKTSFTTLVFLIVPELNSMSEDSLLKQTLNNSTCRSEMTSNKKAARDFLKFVNSNKDHIAPEESPGAFFHITI